MNDCVCLRKAGKIDTCLDCKTPCEDTCKTELLKYQVIHRLPLVLAFATGILVCLTVGSILFNR